MQFKAGLLPTEEFDDRNGTMEARRCPFLCAGLRPYPFIYVLRKIAQVEQLLKERCKGLLRSYFSMDRDGDGVCVCVREGKHGHVCVCERERGNCV